MQITNTCTQRKRKVKSAQSQTTKGMLPLKNILGGETYFLNTFFIAFFKHRQILELWACQLCELAISVHQTLLQKKPHQLDTRQRLWLFSLKFLHSASLSRSYHGEFELRSHAVILHAVSWCCVDQSCSFCHCHMIGGQEWDLLVGKSGMLADATL